MASHDSASPASDLETPVSATPLAGGVSGGRLAAARALQGRIGNAAAARALMREPEGSPPPAAVAPAGAAPPPAAAPSNVKGSYKLTYTHTFDQTPPTKIPPIFEYEGVKIGGELEFEPEGPGGGEENKGASSSTKIAPIAGASSKSGHGAGPNVGGEVKQESALDPVVGGILDGVQPKFDRGIQFTSRDGLEAGGGVEFEGKAHSFAVHFKIVEWEPGSKPKFGVVEPEFKEVEFSKPHVSVPGLGTGTLKFSGKVALIVGPDLVKLVEELVERFGKEVVIDAAFDAGIALVGVATVAATVWEMLYAEQEGREEMDAVLAARDDIVAYCSAYAAVSQGYEHKGGGKAAEEGAAAARAALKKGAKGTKPEGLVADAKRAAGGDIKMEVYPLFRAEARKKLVADWNRNHRVKSALYSIVLMGDIDGGPLGGYFDQVIWADRFPG